MFNMAKAFYKINVGEETYKELVAHKSTLEKSTGRPVTWDELLEGLMLAAGTKIIIK